jgi:hypothetical protein
MYYTFIDFEKKIEITAKFRLKRLRSIEPVFANEIGETDAEVLSRLNWLGSIENLNRNSMCL